MDTANSLLPTILGLQPNEWLTLAAIVIGPIVAVGLTLVFEKVRRSREQRLEIFRTIMTTRHLPGDARYSNSINLIPVEFNKNRAVLDAYNAYIEETRFKPQQGDEEKKFRLLVSKQTKLIAAMAKDLGFKLKESDLEVQAYAADGFIQRDNMVLDALQAIREVAEVLKVQTRMMSGDEAAKNDPLIQDNSIGEGVEL